MTKQHNRLHMCILLFYFWQTSYKLINKSKGCKTLSLKSEKHELCLEKNVCAYSVVRFLQIHTFHSCTSLPQGYLWSFPQVDPIWPTSSDPCYQTLSGCKLYQALKSGTNRWAKNRHIHQENFTGASPHVSSGSHLPLLIWISCYVSKKGQTVNRFLV